MKNWVKLYLLYLGKSKKNHIFRAKKWSASLERILNKPIYTEAYVKVGLVREIFGPIKFPFISVKDTTDYKFQPDEKLYVKLT